jgi:hypothetical protein
LVILSGMKSLCNVSLIILISMSVAGCGPGKFFGTSVTPSSIPTDTPTITPSHTPTYTYTPTPTITDTPIPSPTATEIGGGNGHLVFIFSDNSHCNNTISPFPPEGLYVIVSNYDFTNTHPVFRLYSQGPVYIQGISPDGTKIIISTFINADIQYLSLVDLESETKPITIAPFNLEKSSYSFPAVSWLNDSRLVYIGTYAEVISLLLVDTDGLDVEPISKPDAQIRPVQILFADETGVLWLGSIIKKYYGESHQIWWSSIDGTEHHQINIDQFDPDRSAFKVSHDGHRIIWLDYYTPYQTKVYSGSISNASEGSKFLGTLSGTDYSIHFSSDDNEVILIPFFGNETTFNASQNKYGFGYNHFPIYRVSLDNLEMNQLFVPNYDQLISYGDPVSLSPDGRLVFVNTWVKDREANRVTAAKEILINLDTQASADYVSCMGTLQWLPTLK